MKNFFLKPVRKKSFFNENKNRIKFKFNLPSLSAIVIFSHTLNGLEHIVKRLMII